MRSMMLGDCDHYASPYMRGVKQAMQLLGHEHVEVSIRQPAEQLERQLTKLDPVILWTHMLLWAPPGSPPSDALVSLASGAARRGASIVIHDGDAKAPTRYPHDIGAWCDLALVNHAYDRSAWNVPTLRWPYFAPVQDAIAQPVDGLRWCDLFFAGAAGGGIYAARTELLEGLRARGVELRTAAAGDNTLDRTPAIAASADAVLGFGRPDVPGWVDTRVFQYPGAGGILLHDDVQGYLEPWVHYVPYESGSADSIVDALARLRALTDGRRWEIRRRAFARVQERHSSVARVSQVLARLGIA
ncbi:MAG TPA: glycosyltransferase [Polyangia bacterium]|nr:glycosyltransferase [Polyangia bacterium]